MTRALVLGGGGPVGIAWESGLIAGLAQGGVNLGTADFTMGTSAGSFVGARLALGSDPATLADPIIADQISPNQDRSESQRSSERAAPADLTRLMQLMGEVHSGARNPAEVRAEIGAWALAAETPSEDAFIGSFGRSFSTLPVDAWPERGFACAAVDAQTGAFKMWTKESGVGVVRAVASSCSVPGVYPPVTLNGRRYIDGGMRSATNADMAIGHELVVVIALRLGAGGGVVGERMTAQFDQEIETLKDGGATVLTITPDEGSVEAFGVNLMDFRKRPGAARAGLAQGLAYAKDVSAYWS
ncbi:patatin-like phospholipase family protein [Phenylobacterium sp.]|jgi:NTE family protein|uniref:patatin-like phospholipase family protein n=1 Tax=Phenylobacterium sp. TaxID=1871053 RepID=UPI002E33CD68|nr:patatin-like phospholipase family protein [Phenylobacterium sp.]HEX3367047.1 patatin-like phospholipase family protein [Phenylobacterium sp.]